MATPRFTHSPALQAAPFWSREVDDLLAEVGSTRAGLNAAEAARRLKRDGPNAVAPRKPHTGVRLLLAQVANPIVLILVAATVLSVGLGDVTDGLIILAIIMASAVLGFWQERGASIAVDALLATVRVEAEVLRDGAEVPVPTEEVVVGDVVVLRAGDIVPADCRVIESHSLLADEAALTGESYPTEKIPGVIDAGTPLAGRSNAVFLGAHVVSGSATAVVAACGLDTEFGALSAELAAPEVTTGFERGMTAFGLLLVRVMAILVTAIFVVNVVLNRPVVESLLFSLALAVGLTPQLLPAIVAVSLATGARRMAAENVIVKRLDAIEDLGAMTVLCTDKTGTLTAGAVVLEAALDLDGRASDDVLRLARLNAGLQRGFSNPLDHAILLGGPPQDDTLRLDEVPYDFSRKRLSVLVAGADGNMLVTKGALAGVLEVATDAQMEGAIVPLDAVRPRVDAQFHRLSAEGYRVLGLATRTLAAGHSTAAAEDEAKMVLRGLLTFHDPPKSGVPEAVAELATLGLSVRMITGDNRLAARHLAAAVGLADTTVMTGDSIDRLGDSELAESVKHTMVFAEVEPIHKERLVRALRAAGHTVGFLGDGINDAAALHAADVGISVDSAVDVAKQSAAVVLLDKSLAVVADGVRLGRETFANTLKYVRVTTSANFGNMLSMAAAAAFLPFLPLLPRQILLLNFLSDIPATTIATDAVDAEQLRRPRTWDVPSIRNFMVIFGLISSAFDIVTFLVLRTGFGADAPLFRSGWFVASTATELAVMLVLRTSRPFWRSRPASPLLWTSAVVAAVTVALAFSPLARPLGLVHLPLKVLAALASLTVGYVAVNETVKRRVLERQPLDDEQR